MAPRALAVALCLAGALVLAACGGDQGASGGPRRTVDIYSGLPLQGPQRDHAAAIVKGIRVAVEEAQGRAGSVAIRYRSLDDSTPEADGWDAQRVAHNAEVVAHDRAAVGYIGEFDSSATEISAPVLNRAGIAQVTPASTYVGLTIAAPGTRKDEPRRYFPTGTRTLLRIVPRDTVQAAALVVAMKRDGCKRVAVASDGVDYGYQLSLLVRRAAQRRKLRLLAPRVVDDSDSSRHEVTAQLESARADCVLYSGWSIDAAVRVFRVIAAHLPKARLYAPEPLCQPRFTNPREKGVPVSVGRRLKCTAAVLPLDSYLGGKLFAGAYRALYGTERPDPYAIYGYESARLFIDAIARLGPAGTTRRAVRDALFAVRERSSVLGQYSFTLSGDTTATDYGLYTVGPDGNPRFFRGIKPG